MKFFCLALLVTCPSLLRADDPAPAPAGKAEHVVVMVWDGLRPDSVTDADTPTLARLGREGVIFTRHHPVYPSLTEVNGTAMATGCYPGHSGVIGNTEYRPAIDPLKVVGTESLATIRRGDELSGGKYLRVPTLPELVHAAGGRTAVAGTKPVAVLWDRAERHDADRNIIGSVTLFGGNVLPPGVLPLLNDANGGPFPGDVHFPNSAQDAWTTKALTGALWKDGPPKFSVLLDERSRLHPTPVWAGFPAGPPRARQQRREPRRRSRRARRRALAGQDGRVRRFRPRLFHHRASR